MLGIGKHGSANTQYKVCEGGGGTFEASRFLCSDTCCRGWDGGGRNPGRKAAEDLGKRTSTLCRDATLESHMRKRASKWPRVSDPEGRGKHWILPEWYLSKHCGQLLLPPRPRTVCCCPEGMAGCEGPVNPEIGAPRTGPPPRSLRTSLSTDCPLEPKVLKPPDSLIGKAQILRGSIMRFPSGWLPGLYPRGGCTR